MAPDPDRPAENPALHALRQLFLPLIAEAPDAVVICNTVGHIIVVNAKVESWFGYTPPELHGQPLTMLLPERFRSAPLGQWAHSLVTPQGPIGLAHPLAGRRKNGQEFPLDMSLSPLLLQDELFVVSILRDTVGRAQEDAAKQRTELLVILGQLAAAVSHEIRNPLQSLSLHIELLEEALRPSGPLRESFATIKTELARVPNVRREPIAVGAMLEAIVQEQQAQATARRVTLHLEGTQTLGHAALHLFTFRRAVLNLLANALEAMPNGGHLTLAGQRTASHLVLTVQDTGVGMTAEELRRLFTSLYTTKPHGTGLGLYVVREILKAHGGTVEATSTPGRGTIFTIRLPLVVAGEISTV
jgi:PAS domain S-box-containing protein